MGKFRIKELGGQYSVEMKVTQKLTKFFWLFAYKTIDIEAWRHLEKFDNIHDAKQFIHDILNPPTPTYYYLQEDGTYKHLFLESELEQHNR